MEVRQRIKGWDKQPCVVAASGPSLTVDVAEHIRAASGWKVLAVNDAYRLMPWADALYAADFAWWRVHNGAPGFKGERWTSHSTSTSYCDDKSQVASEFDLNFVRAADGAGFAKSGIHYGNQAHSGFQAVNLAVVSGCSRIVLVGFDYGYTRDPHFFGRHPDCLRNPSDNDYKGMARAFYSVDCGVEILNATPDSALSKFPMVSLSEELWRDDSVHRDRAESFAATG